MFILPEIANGEDKSSPFINCIRNTYRHVRKWAKRTHTNCFRIYDRQLYHYPLAIDFYAGRYSVHYFSPSRDVDEPPIELVSEVEKALSDTFRAIPDDIFWRSRIKRKKHEQYEKQNVSQEFFTVYEYGVKFKVNLVDYLDTGLFLDHRELRLHVASHAQGKRVLNLFSYTASFSVHAANHGATFTKSVDMSNTYTEWAKDNFVLNNISLQNHELVRADCLKFLDDEIERGIRYDVIVIDPPTISRSKKMDQLFDVQKDYVLLIRKAERLLTGDGVIFFSTNCRKFVFDLQEFLQLTIVDISKKTLPVDFHDVRIRQAWKIKKSPYPKKA
jgi:23S rRNA (cytosine1962-C5)-methyltransferase